MRREGAWGWLSLQEAPTDIDFGQDATVGSHPVTHVGGDQGGDSRASSLSLAVTSSHFPRAGHRELGVPIICSHDRPD